MENNNITQPIFDQLPKAVSEINSKMDYILQELKALGANKQDAVPDMMTLEECAKFLGKTTSTIYTMTSKNAIPHHKGGNKLYFFKHELIEWLTKRQQTSSTGETIEERALAIATSKKHKPKSFIDQQKKEEEAQLAIQRAAEAEAKQTAAIQSSLPTFAIHCEKHTKTNADIYVLKFTNPLTSDQRNIVEPSVKSFGGYWSGMWSGYLFNDASAAHQCADAIRQNKGKEKEEPSMAD